MEKKKCILLSVLTLGKFIGMLRSLFYCENTTIIAPIDKKKVNLSYYLKLLSINNNVIFYKTNELTKIVNNFDIVILLEGANLDLYGFKAYLFK